MNERDIAEAIATGRLPSPTPWLGSNFYRMKISGVGVAWRPSIKEFVYRPASVWLAPPMVARVAGLPVIAGHPSALALDGNEFFNRIVGMALLGFVDFAAGELWSIVRVIDARACKILDSGKFDTSPGVIFLPDNNTRLKIGNDDLLIEEEPALIDHVALISTEEGNGGVWTRDGDALGVSVDQTANERQTNDR